MHNMLLVVVQRKATVGKSEHAAVVGIEPGKQGSPTGESRRSTEGFPEQDSFLRESLQVRVGTDWP